MKKNLNYQKGGYAGIDTPRLNDTAAVAQHGDSMLSYYMSKFYAAARGHLVNKYHIGLWGPYVWEALRILDRNSYADKYSLGNVKTFKNTTDAHIKASFNNWATLFYSKETRVLNMYWAAQSVKVGEATAKKDNFAGLDTTKGMKYPLIMGDEGPKELTITVVDDPYMMWYQFFNALYNAQFSPLVLKARSTWHKINIAIDLYSEATTVMRSGTGQYATEKSPFITDMSLNQMYEFNSAIMLGAPSMEMGYDKSNPFTFQVRFRYPNAFQGTFKQQLRYLRDNTCDGTDVTAYDAKNNRLRRNFFEDDYNRLKKTGSMYDAFNATEYYNEYGNRYFQNPTD